MADAAVTIKLRPAEFDLVRDGLISYYDNLEANIKDELRHEPKERGAAKATLLQLDTVLQAFGCIKRSGGWSA